MSNPKLPAEKLHKVVGHLRHRLEEMGFPDEEPWDLDQLAADLAVQGGKGSSPSPEAAELRPHLTAEEMQTALVAAQIESRFGVRIAQHLVGATCDRCQDALTQAGPTPAGAEPSRDPLVLALRRVADDAESDAPLSPMRRFLVDRWCRHPLAFARLVLEEALGVEVERPSETVRWVAVAGIRLLPVAALRLLERQFDDLVTLIHSAMAEGLRRADRSRAGIAHLTQAYTLGRSQDPEVRSVLVATRGRLDVALGNPGDGFQELEEAARLLREAGLPERRAELLEEVAALRDEPVAEEAC